MQRLEKRFGQKASPAGTTAGSAALESDFLDEDRLRLWCRGRPERCAGAPSKVHRPAGQGVVLDTAGQGGAQRGETFETDLDRWRK